jgi:hypothetical protein
MLNELKEQKSFLKIVFKNKGKYNDILKNFESFFGYKPSKEFIELAECFPAYTRYFESISDTWMLEGDISYVGDFIKKDTKVENLINGDGFIFTLLTGLERFGSDPSGDSCFLNTLPHPVDTAEVYGYDHECGELNGYVAFSLADFVSDIWVTSYDFESDEEIDKSTDKVKKVIASFNNGYKAEIKQRPYYDDPKVLFDRAEWIFGHTTGEPSFHFAEKMSGAPDFKKWKKEKNLISKVPVLANYWLLAHFFLGNKNACRECIELAKKTPGKVTPINRKSIKFFRQRRF